MGNYIIHNGKLYGVDELYHYGVKGMKWGVRRYQDESGRLTQAGRDRIKSLGDGYYKRDNEIYKKVKGKKVGTIKYDAPTEQVYNLEVDKNHRGNNYGSKLLDLSMNEFDVRSIAVRKDNKVPYEMYVKRGFEDFASFLNPYDGNSDTMWMDLNGEKYAEYVGLGKDYINRMRNTDIMNMTSAEINKLAKHSF